MRFLHAADLHLDSPLRSVALRDEGLGASLRRASRRVLETIVETAIARRVDAVLLAGDVFDSEAADLTSKTAFVRAVARPAAAGIPTVAIRGNHDALLDIEAHGRAGDGLHVLHEDNPSVRVGDATIHGTSFRGRREAQSSLPRYGPPEGGRINVGLMHTSLGGAPGHDSYAPVAPSDLLAHGYDYWALGHIHRRSEVRSETALAVMAGIPQGRHVGEPGRGGATLVTIDGLGARAEAIPLAALAFERVEIELDGATQAADLGAIQAVLERAAREGHAVALRVVLRGAGARSMLAGGDPAAVVREMAAEFPGLHVERVRIEPGGAAEPVVEGLSAAMRREAAEPATRDAAQGAITALMEALPPEVRGAVGEAGLDAVMADAMALAQARLPRGA